MLPLIQPKDNNKTFRNAFAGLSQDTGTTTSSSKVPGISPSLGSAETQPRSGDGSQEVEEAGDMFQPLVGRKRVARKKAATANGNSAEDPVK